MGIVAVDKNCATGEPMTQSDFDTGCGFVLMLIIFSAMMVPAIDYVMHWRKNIFGPDWKTRHEQEKQNCGEAGIGSGSRNHSR
jgi:hypothetical protein